MITNQTYILSKDKNKNNVTNVEIHDIVFNIILEIDRICRKNNIPYALSFGSALGLVEFGGFIPWDDDADIAIDYFDLPRFIDALKNDLGNDYVFDCFETDSKYNVLIPTMKVRYKHSDIVETNSLFVPNRCKNGNGLFVDICVFMGVPTNVRKHKNLFIKSKLMMPWMCLLEGLLHINPLLMKKSLKKYENKIANKYKDSDSVSQTVIIPFQELPLKVVKTLSFPKEVIYPFKEYDFNGVKLFSFNNVKEFARLRYGKFTYPTKIKPNHLKRVDIFYK